MLNGAVEPNGRGKKRSYEYHPQGGVKRTKYHDETPGTIKHIKLENFMTHQVFTWEPIPNINFLTGKNGSGKSSVLQALVLGLNGEVKNMKRYNLPREFIKKDTNQATIEITLSNTGEDAFKPELYGDTVTVQRVISETSSRYTLKDASMKDVLKKKEAKEELVRMLDKFQIQVDSPIVILHQDVAKEMLKIESPNSLYNFFERATLIKHCQDGYLEAEKEYVKAQHNMHEKKKALSAIYKEFKACKIMYDAEEERRKLNVDYTKARGEYAWSRVHEAKKEKAKKEEEIKNLEEKLVVPQNKLLNLHDENTLLKQRQVELEVKMEEEKSRYQKQEEEVTRLKEECDSLKQEQKSITQQAKENGNIKNSLIQEVRLLQSQIERLQKTDSAGEKEKRARERQVQLRKLASEQEATEIKISNEGITRDAQDKQIKEETIKEKSLKLEMRRIDLALQQVRSDLENLEKSNQGDMALAVFGAKIPALNRAIKSKSSSFSRIPVGPIGHHVHLKGEAGTNQNLARLLEAEVTRAQLNSYITTNDNDRRTLMDIIKTVYKNDTRSKPRIFTSKFIDRRHQITKPSCDFPTVESYLNIDDDNVFNHLVDQKSIEKILVCRTQDDAKRLMSYRQNVPDNVLYTITHDFNRFFPPKGKSSYRSYYIDVPTGSSILRSTMSSHVQEKKEEISNLTSQKRDLDMSMKSVETSKRSFEAEKRRAVQEINSLRKKLSGLKAETTKIKSEEEHESFTNEADNLKIKLQIKQTEQKSIQENIAEIVEKKRLLAAQISDKEAELKKGRASLNKVKESSEFSGAYKELETSMSRMGKEINNQEKLIAMHKKLIEDHKRGVKELTTNERKFREAAIKVIPDEIVPDKSSKELNGKIHAMKKKLEHKNKNKGEKDDTVNYLELKERYSNLKDQIDTLTNHMKTIEDMRKERLDLIISLRSYITNIVRRNFNTMIKEFATKLDSEIFLRIDHEKKTLKFVFKNGGGERTNSDVSALSGGEKSYTQMCLICSLWKVMNPPFRCLDEWDVFLDAVNRKNISRELLNFGLQHPDKQFIFISPQGACDISDTPHGQVAITEIKKS